MSKLTDEQIEWAASLMKGFAATFPQGANSVPWSDTHSSLKALWRSHAKHVLESLYAPTEPGAPLSEKEKQEIADAFPAGFVPQWIIAIWREIDAILVRRNVRKAAPKIDGDVIEAASATYDSAKDADYTGSPSEKHDCMATAARVIVDALIELIHAYRIESGEPDYKEYPADTCEELIARLRDYIKPKTPEERVTITPGVGECYAVYKIDGAVVEPAEIVSALIAQLKQEARK